jgi:hypothetical protein
MSKTAEYIKRLSDLQEGERSRLRLLAGRPLDATLQGFDLFTGLWWPLRAKSPATPRREPSWLVAKLFGTFRVPHIRPDSGAGPSLPEVLGRCEPPRPDCRFAEPLSSIVPDREPDKSQFIAARKYRRRFDALLCSPLTSLEPHLRWALGEVARAVAGHVPHALDVKGLDWVQLLDDLSIWNRGDEHRRGRDVREIWAEIYLNASDSK